MFFGGQSVGVFNPANTAQWQTFSANLVGGSGDGSDRLEFRGLGPEDDIGVGLDNIILQPFSAPAIDAALQATSNDGLDGGAGNDTLRGGTDITILKVQDLFEDVQAHLAGEPIPSHRD